MTMYGLDLLGIAKFKDVAVKNFPAGWALGAFSQTFGDALPAVEAIIKTGKCPRVRLHLLWKDQHDFTSKDIPLAVKEAKRVKKLVDKYPAIEWLISGCCEHKMNGALAKQFKDKILQVLPTVTYVNSYMEGGASLPDCINEIHGTKAREPKVRPYQFSFDGNSASDANIPAIEQTLDEANTFFFWNSKFNGKTKDEDKTPREKRTAWPDSNYMKAIIYLASIKGNTSLPKNALWKPISEKNFPCLITPIKSNKVELRVGGKAVHTLKYFGTYVDGRHRYYASKWGYQLGVCEVWINNKKYGTVNCGFRENSYR